jgi:nitroreductase
MAAATQNILLEVTELGLGAVWIGIAPMAERMENVRKVLQVPEQLNPYAIIPIGYPVEGAEQKDRFDAERVHFI